MSCGIEIRYAKNGSPFVWQHEVGNVQDSVLNRPRAWQNQLFWSAGFKEKLIKVSGQTLKIWWDQREELKMDRTNLRSLVFCLNATVLFHHGDSLTDYEDGKQIYFVSMLCSFLSW
jgi:hypothetical protein